MAGRSRAIDRAEARLEQIYRDAEDELVRQIAADDDAGRLGSKAYRERRLAAIRQALSDLQDRTVPLGTELIAAAYTGGATAAALSVGAAVPDFGRGIHREALEILADNLANGLNGAAENVGRYVDDLYRRAGLEAASQMVAEGGTRRGASKALEAIMKQAGLSAGPDGASSWKLSRYTQMVIRTNTADAIVRGNVNVAMEEGYDLVEVLVADPCDLCAPYDGEVFSLTGRPGYESIYDFGVGGLPPFHPNCRCDLNILSEDPRGT